MKDMETVLKSIEDVYQKLKEQNYAQSTIKTYQMVYKGLIRYMSDQKIAVLNEKVCLDYLYCRTGYRKDGFFGKGNRKINQVLKPLEVLICYMDTGKVEYRIRAKLPPYQCPSQFQEEYIGIQEQFEERHSAPATIKNHIQKITKFLTFLDERGVRSSEEIDPQAITDYIKLYENHQPKYIATIISVLRNYLTFLHLQGYTASNKSVTLPRIRVMRNAFIPYVWSREDVRKLLAIIDREDAKGKRDYAIILLVARLGLRVSDIRNMKLENIDWQRKVIVMNMIKTDEGIELPLLDDIGWAIIDYLQNGRPRTKCKRVFVRHRAPYGAVGENESFYRELHRYMVAADIRIPLEPHCGLHSLRSTLARNMLESEVPLPVISETLGHKSIHTTSIYLKIDLKGLRKCALDPEAVFMP